MPLLPMPVNDEHLLSLVHAYFRLNGLYHRPSVFGYDWYRLVFVNQAFNYHYTKAATLFVPLMPPETFLDRYGFSRLCKPYVNAEWYSRILTCRNLPKRAIGEATLEGRLLVHDAAHFWFCPVCRAHDIANEGYARWRRTHQVRGVLVCPVHACRLIKSCAGCGYCPGEVFAPEADVIGCAHCGIDYLVSQPSGETSSRWLIFAQFIHALLSDHVPEHEAMSFIVYVETKAMARFGVHLGGVPSRIRREVETTFGTEVLTELNLHTREGASAGWIRWFFARLGYTDDFRAYALIGAVVFDSIDEWMSAYTAVSRMPSNKPRVPAEVSVIPLSARLLRDLAWQSDLSSLGYREETLKAVIANVPGLLHVRSTRLIRAKEDLLPLKQYVLHSLLNTRSKHAVRNVLYEAERRTMGRGRKITQATLETIAYRWYRLHGDEHPMPAEQRIRLYGVEAEKVIAQTHEKRRREDGQPRYYAAVPVDAVQNCALHDDSNDRHQPADPVIDDQVEILAQDRLAVLSDE